MTAVQWVGNVAHLPQPPDRRTSGEVTAPVRVFPAHLNPRAGQDAAQLWARIRRSPLARDLSDWAWVVTFLTSIVLVLSLVDHLRGALQ